MYSIKVKNNAGTEVIYNNIDTVVLKASDGSDIKFRQWNSAEDGVSVTTLINRKHHFISTEEPMYAVPDMSIEII